MFQVRHYALLSTLIFFSPIAISQTQIWNSTEGLKSETKNEEVRLIGWSKSANLGLNFSMTSSQDVVGQTDGTSQTYGTSLKSGFKRLTERSEWRNEVLYSGATTRSPSLPRFVKSADELKLSTIYLQTLEMFANVGPYARAEASAPIFVGEDVRSNSQNYLIRSRNQATRNVNASSLRLTEGFKPLTTKEAVGVFYKPVQQKKINLELRLGLGAMQVFAEGQYSVGGLNSAGQIEVNELQDVNQVGVETGLSLRGSWNENSSYELGAESLTPFLTNQNSNDDRDAVRLTNFDAFAKLSSKINSWASLGYDYKVKIQPQLVDRAQQTHMFVLNINYNLL